MIEKVTDDTFQAFLGTNKTIVLDFTATWCGSCKILNPMLKEASEQFPDISFGQINVDENPFTTQKFEVMSMPTLIFLRNGEMSL